MRSLGIDAEPDGPLRERMGQRICTPQERSQLSALPARPGGWERLVFSAKESFYKAYHPLAKTFLGFQDVALELDPEAGRFEARLLREDKPGPRYAVGRFVFAPPHLITGVTLLHEDVGG